MRNEIRVRGTDLNAVTEAISCPILLTRYNIYVGFWLLGSRKVLDSQNTNIRRQRTP